MRSPPSPRSQPPTVQSLPSAELSPTSSAAVATVAAASGHPHASIEDVSSSGSALERLDGRAPQDYNDQPSTFSNIRNPQYQQSDYTHEHYQQQPMTSIPYPVPSEASGPSPAFIASPYPMNYNNHYQQSAPLVDTMPSNSLYQQAPFPTTDGLVDLTTGQQPYPITNYTTTLSLPPTPAAAYLPTPYQKPSKQPFYRRKRVWLVLVILLAIVLGALGGTIWKPNSNGNNNANSNSNNNQSGNGPNGSKTVTSTGSSTTPVSSPLTPTSASTLTGSSTTTTPPPAATTTEPFGGASFQCQVVCGNTNSQCISPCGNDPTYLACKANCPSGDPFCPLQCNNISNPCRSACTNTWSACVRACG